VDHDVLPVLSHDRRKRWIGMLTRRNIIERLHEELERSTQLALHEHLSLRAIEEESKISQLVTAIPGRRPDVQRLFVPIDAIGKSLKECDFRRKYDVQVIAIEQRDGSFQCPPDPDASLRTDQRLLAVVWRPDRPATRAGAT
jgi:K+/H+ antiporter YhaU regulatory subunit KhtT